MVRHQPRSCFTAVDTLPGVPKRRQHQMLLDASEPRTQELPTRGMAPPQVSMPHPVERLTLESIHEKVVSVQVHERFKQVESCQFELDAWQDRVESCRNDRQAQMLFLETLRSMHENREQCVTGLQVMLYQKSSWKLACSELASRAEQCHCSQSRMGPTLL